MCEEEPTTILHLYGTIVDVVGQNEVKITAHTVAEALYALASQVPELEPVFAGANWALVNGPLEGGVPLLVDELGVTPASEIHLMPATEGGSGSSMIILGAALVACAFFPPIAGGVLATGMIGAGASMIVGGIAQSLVKTPKSNASSSSGNTDSSFIFGSTSGSMQQGKPIPVVYGEDLVEPQLVSVSVEAEDYVETK